MKRAAFQINLKCSKRDVETPPPGKRRSSRVPAWRRSSIFTCRMSIRLPVISPISNATGTIIDQSVNQVTGAPAAWLKALAGGTQGGRKDGGEARTFPQWENNTGGWRTLVSSGFLFFECHNDHYPAVTVPSETYACLCIHTHIYIYTYIGDFICY